MSTIRLVYIGDHFYYESGTMMSPIYHESGERSDWGKVSCYLRDGDEVHIRQAAQSEKDKYEGILARYKRERKT